MIVVDQKFEEHKQEDEPGAVRQRRKYGGDRGCPG